MKRRDAIRNTAIGAVGGIAAALAQKNEAMAQTYSKSTAGLPPLKITNVKAIACQPSGVRFVAVKIETSEPGLYGLGCATFNQRPLPVISAINDYLAPFCKGKDVDNIEDMWQTMYVSSYWRNGPVLNNAMSGVDMALWDIKGKRANMPVYQLLGGACRFAVPLFGNAGGRDFAQLDENIKKQLEQGYHHIRTGPVGVTSSRKADFKDAGFGAERDGFMDNPAYMRGLVKTYAHIRETFGDEIEIMTDIHERLHPADAIVLIKELEKYRPFFIEDPFSPEDIGYFRNLRQLTSVPIAMGELFNNPHEWVGLISERLFDYIRIHISQIGGLTPARKVAILGEWFNVRTVWHGPYDHTPIGQAAQIHLDMATSNFAIQEGFPYSEKDQEVFKGCPTIKNGYMSVNPVPGLGVDIDEKAAAKYPLPADASQAIWWPRRNSDGSAMKP